MGWTVLPKPGTEHGPCEGECGHTDCAYARRVAESKCKHCGEAIGYEKGFYVSDACREIYAHAVCEWEHVKKETAGG